jgi:hypothetical protein
VDPSASFDRFCFTSDPPREAQQSLRLKISSLSSFSLTKSRRLLLLVNFQIVRRCCTMFDGFSFARRVFSWISSSVSTKILNYSHCSQACYLIARWHASDRLKAGALVPLSVSSSTVIMSLALSYHWANFQSYCIVLPISSFALSIITLLLLVTVNHD